MIPTNRYPYQSYLERGLTLIELLIVIGILFIVSGIAMENFLTASIRAKVSRVAAESRTFATAIEAYRADHNVLPRMAHAKFYSDPSFDHIGGTAVSGVMSRALSTPIAYLSSCYLIDPFMTSRQDSRLDERLYTYQVLQIFIDHNPNSKFWPQALEFYGDWRLASVGPDQTFDHRFTNSAQLPYDPTNGLVSFGNIWASQKSPNKMPPVPQLLGQ